jgi:hypothetical protein
MSATGDFKKIRRRAEDQGWRVEKRKEYWLFFPPMVPSHHARWPVRRRLRDRSQTSSPA